jgi:hypothetical protein
MLQDAAPTRTVRTVLHLSPAVASTAIVVAQRRGLRLQQWLDSIVVDACVRAGRTTPVGSLSDKATADLFVRVAMQAPQLLAGPWKLLFEQLRLRQDLWDYPAQTLEQVETEPHPPITLNAERVHKAWPELVH